MSDTEVVFKEGLEDALTAEVGELSEAEAEINPQEADEAQGGDEETSQGDAAPEPQESDEVEVLKETGSDPENEQDEEDEEDDIEPEDPGLGGGGPGGGPTLAMALGEAPDLGEAAEIVVIGTSLGSIKRQFFSSRRVQHFLDCKGVVYFILDCNRDMSSAMNLKDTELYKEWRSQGILRTVSNPDNEGAEPEVELPQVLVDGVVLGGETDLQELEEDGDLDWIFARAACPACLHEKPTDASNCASCGAVFTSLIPPEILESGGVQQMLQGYVYNAAAEETSGEKLKERWASGLQQADFDWEEGKRLDTEGETGG